MFRKTKVENPDGSPTDEVPDSELAPPYIDFNGERRKKTDEEKKEQPRIPDPE
jgi:hypothetical protein